MHDTSTTAQRHNMPPTTLERYLTELANVDMPYQTVYIEPGTKLQSFSSVIPGLSSILDLSPVLSSINDGDVGAALFWDTQKLRIVLPPLPIASQSLSVGLDTGPLLALFRTEPIIGVCLVRLGRFGIGVYQGSTLLNSKTDRRFVKGRHKKGGSSSNRFRRIREKQADELYKKVCTILQNQFGPYERKLDHLFLGGEASTLVGCKTFVLISTDKAVNPTSLMGASKRMAEIVCQVLDQESATRFVTVRFGNVLGSAGSVVPLFRKQIEDGGPVTVTHPDMTRYFMTMAEACQLILQASVAGSGQAIYVLNMGEPVKISDLAEQMIRLAGLRTDKDIRIEFTGLRPGEKLKEELFHDLESLSPTGFEKLLLADSREVDRETVLDGCRQLADACNDYDYQTIVRVMKRLVPEYREAKNDRSNGAKKVQATERGKGEIHNVKSPAGTTDNLRTEPVESSKS